MTFQTPAVFPVRGNWHVIDVAPDTDTEVVVIFVCPDCAKTTEGEVEKPVPVIVMVMMLEL
jgi:acetone carboxylase gamma subunit